MRFAGYVVGHSDALSACLNHMMYPCTYGDPNTILKFYRSPEVALRAARGKDGRGYGGICKIWTHDGKRPETSYGNKTRLLVYYVNPESEFLEVGETLDEAVVEVPYRTDRKILADLKVLKPVPYAAEIETKRQHAA